MLLLKHSFYQSGSLWLRSFETAKATIAGYEAMHMIRKGQVKKSGYQSASSQVQFIEELFGIAA